jgi:Mrp family chromosome partitioning ATPase
VQNEPTAPLAARTLDERAESPPPVRPAATPGELELAALVTSSAQAAPFRDLLAVVERDTTGKQRPIIALVGLDEQDATGLVAAALATLSVKNQSVLLVEANPHGRELAKRFAAAEAIGLCESLSGRTVRDDNIVPTSQQNLDLLPFGRATSAQAELLPPSLPPVLSQLRGRYDRTLIDAGPLSGPWAAVVSQAADAVYLLVHLGDTSAEHAVRCVERFRAAGGKLHGCIALGSSADPTA